MFVSPKGHDELFNAVPVKHPPIFDLILFAVIQAKHHLKTHTFL